MDKNAKDTTLDDIKEIIEGFDNDFDDPFEALQEIADLLGIKKKISECEDDDDDDLPEDEDDDDFFGSDDD